MKYFQEKFNEIKFYNYVGNKLTNYSMLLLSFFASICLRKHMETLYRRPRIQETVRERLKRLYKDHHTYSYSQARVFMYNEVDCEEDEINLIYSGSSYSWKCHQTKKPSATDVNAEHIVPQSTFKSKTPMVSDLHHLLPASAKLNNVRSNYNFTEVDYSQCKQFCRGMTCSTTKPSDPDSYSCLTNNKKWMPLKLDRGRVARAVLYFYTMYDEYPMSVGELSLFKKWNNLYLPSDYEKLRNDRINTTQGNRNPYIDDPTLVDQAFP